MDVGSAALITALTYVVVSLKYVLSALLPERCAEIPMIGRAGIEGAHTVHFQKRAVDREQIGRRDKAGGKVANKLPQAKIRLCPLLSESGQMRVRSDCPLSANSGHGLLHGRSCVPLFRGDIHALEALRVDRLLHHATPPCFVHQRRECSLRWMPPTCR